MSWKDGGSYASLASFVSPAGFPMSCALLSSKTLPHFSLARDSDEKQWNTSQVSLTIRANGPFSGMYVAGKYTNPVSGNKSRIGDEFAAVRPGQDVPGRYQTSGLPTWP